MQPNATKIPFPLLVLTVLVPVSLLTASEPSDPAPPPPPQQAPADPPAGKNARSAIPSRAELEKEFKQTMTGATLRGTWQMTGEGGLTGKAPLTPAQDDSYTILSVNKGIEDFWIVNARIRFGDKDVTVPVPVRVVWAEDTPIITLNDLTIPGIGTYSARVMIFKGFYCGTWFCGEKNYGGIMSGKIFHDAPSPDNAKDAG
jgi:hypothetical protein